MMWRINVTEVSGLEAGPQWVIAANYGGKGIKSPPIAAGPGPKATFRFRDAEDADAVTVVLEKDGAPAGELSLALGEFRGQTATDFPKTVAVGAASVSLVVRCDRCTDDEDEQASCMETGDEDSSCVIS